MCWHPPGVTRTDHLLPYTTLFRSGWLVTGHVVPVSPAASVRGPAHSQRRGKTPVLAPDEARALLDRIDVTTDAGFRDRALIGLMVYSFARIGAALALRVAGVLMQNRRPWVRLHEQGRQRQAQHSPPQRKDVMHGKGRDDTF